MNLIIPANAYTVKLRLSAPPPRICVPFIENQLLHRPKTKNYITEGAKKKKKIQ